MPGGISGCVSGRVSGCVTPVFNPFIEEVDVLDEQTEEGDHTALREVWKEVGSPLEIIQSNHM